jgi:PAS domain S-box-containing protein
MMNWRDALQSLDVTQIFLAAVGGVGAVFLWMKRRYLSFANWRKVREERRAALNELPMRVSGFAELLSGVSERTDRALAVLNAHTETLADQNRVLGNISAMIHGEMELDPTPRFICDNDGRNLNVNTAYARLVGCGRDELLNFGYQRFIPADLNPVYMDGYEEAVRQHRSFESTIKIRRPDGTVITTNVRIVPHPENGPPAHYWVGVVVGPIHRDGATS